LLLNDYLSVEENNFIDGAYVNNYSIELAYGACSIRFSSISNLYSEFEESTYIIGTSFYVAITSPKSSLFADFPNLFKTDYVVMIYCGDINLSFKESWISHGNELEFANFLSYSEVYPDPPIVEKTSEPVLYRDISLNKAKIRRISQPDCMGHMHYPRIDYRNGDVFKPVFYSVYQVFGYSKHRTPVVVSISIADSDLRYAWIAASKRKKRVRMYWCSCTSDHLTLDNHSCRPIAVQWYPWYGDLEKANVKFILKYDGDLMQNLDSGDDIDRIYEITKRSPLAHFEKETGVNLFR